MVARNFKTDESFLQKIAIGATATKMAIAHLDRLGFRPIELERGSSGYKIWKKIKIKRVRVPDILCLKTGTRFEVRGKTKLEISMSHSLKDPYRSWDAGMRSDDYVCIVLCRQFDEKPISWEIDSPFHFVKVQDLKESADKGHVTITKPKGVEEGSEIRMIWPSSIANEDSEVVEVNENSLKLRSLDGQFTQRCLLPRKKFALIPQCQSGMQVKRNQIVASTVPVTLAPKGEKNVGVEQFAKQIRSASLSERYAAAKALRFIGASGAEESLAERMNDQSEDIYVKLEAAAALCTLGDEEAWGFLSKSLKSDFLTVQLETVIVLSELSGVRSERMLIEVLNDQERDSEVRAGAAWSLGQFKTTHSVGALISSFNSTSEEIRIEAARALLKIGPTQTQELIQGIKAVTAEKRDGIAWALSRVGGFDPNQLLNGRDDRNLKIWLSYIVGMGKGKFSENELKTLFSKDSEVEFAVSVLWQLIESWVYELEEY